MKPTYRRRPSAAQEHPPEDLGEEIRYGLGQSSIGWVLVATSDQGIVSVLIDADRNSLLEDLHQRFPLAHLVLEKSRGENALSQVLEHIEDPSQKFDLPLDLRGTDFQKRVWRAVQQIPVGHTSNYSEIAQHIGSPKAIRAVGSASANSHHSMVIPCHRVLHKDGSLSRGAWGGERQRIMIDREAKWKSKAPAPKRRKPALKKIDKDSV